MEIQVGVDLALARVEVGEIQAGLEPVDIAAEGEDLVEGAELGALAHRLDPQT